MYVENRLSLFLTLKSISQLNIVSWENCANIVTLYERVSVMNAFVYLFCMTLLLYLTKKHFSQINIPDSCIVDITTTITHI